METSPDPGQSPPPLPESAVGKPDPQEPKEPDAVPEGGKPGLPESSKPASRALVPRQSTAAGPRQGSTFEPRRAARPNEPRGVKERPEARRPDPVAAQSVPDFDSSYSSRPSRRRSQRKQQRFFMGLAIAGGAVILVAMMIFLIHNGRTQ